MFNCLSIRHKASLYCIGLLCLLTSLFISSQAFARDYLELRPNGVSKSSVYCDEMFRRLVNPAAVRPIGGSLTFDIAGGQDGTRTRSIYTEYNRSQFSIWGERSGWARAKICFEEGKLEDVYEPLREIDELVQAAVSTNVPVTDSIYIGVGSRICHLNGLHFETGKAGQASAFGNFDMNLTWLAVDAGTVTRLWQSLYLSLYVQNALYFTLDETYAGEAAGGIASELDLAAPVVFGVGPGIGLGQLVASLDLRYLPQVGGEPGIRGTAFYTFFPGGDNLRLKIGAGVETVTDSDLWDNVKAEVVASFWMSNHLSIRYAIGISHSPEDDSDVYHRAGVSLAWQ